jgi:hypothetical protein
LIDQHGKTPKAFAIPAHRHVSREKVRAEEFKQMLWFSAFSFTPPEGAFSNWTDYFSFTTPETDGPRWPLSLQFGRYGSKTLIRFSAPKKAALPRSFVDTSTVQARCGQTLDD